MPPEIVDSHCHLDFPDFNGELPEIIARARAAGVTRMVTICTKLANEPQVRAIAEAYDGVFYAAGTHPMSAADQPLATVEQLVALASHPKFVGIGETGLDYHYTADSAAIQQTSLRVHIQAAQETGLPLIIHARAADDDMARILAEGMAELVPRRRQPRNGDVPGREGLAHARPLLAEVPVDPARRAQRGGGCHRCRAPHRAPAVARRQEVGNRVLGEAAQIGRDQQRDQDIAAGPAHDVGQAVEALQVQHAGGAYETGGRHPIGRGGHAVVDEIGRAHV